MIERFELAKDYTISKVINGCWQLSEGHSLKTKIDKEDILKTFHILVDQGFTTFDCADIYTGVEELLGEFVKQIKSRRDISQYDIQFHTKYVPDLNLLKDIDYKYTEKIIDRSLKRLNRDVLDLVQFHWWDYNIPGYIETAGHLYKLKEKGKIANIGVTNFDTKHLKEIVDAGIPIVSSQSQYSIFDRRLEKKLLDYCRSQGIFQICYGTLAGGLLSEKWIDKESIEPATRSHVKYLQVMEDTLGLDGYQEILLLLNEIAQKHSVSIPHIATKYILSQSGVGATIIGIRNSNHIESNKKIFDFTLDDSDIKSIKSFLDNYPVLDGEPFDLERNSQRYRSIMKMNLNEE